jgi:hypothetical protein
MGRGFLAARGMAAKPPGEETEPAVAGGRSSRAMRGALRSDRRHRDRVGRALRTERTDLAMADQRHSSLSLWASRTPRPRPAIRYWLTTVISQPRAPASFPKGDRGAEAPRLAYTRRPQSTARLPLVDGKSLRWYAALDAGETKFAVRRCQVLALAASLTTTRYQLMPTALW